MNEVKWNNLLEHFWKSRSKLEYDEFKFNCLDFVLSFLVLFGYYDKNFNQSNEQVLFDKGKTKIKINLKQHITKHLIEPVLKKSLNYLFLLIKLNDEAYVIEKK
jgi:hypothetical protein